MTIPVSATSRDTLKESVDVIAPRLVGALCDDSSLSRLRALAEALPPIHRAGFECRLGEGERQVDLQQCVIRTEWELRAIREYAAARHDGVASSLRAAWHAVERLTAAWKNPDSTMARAASELWLEFDVIADAGESIEANLAPSVFAVLNHDDNAATIEALAHDLLDPERASAVATRAHAWDATLRTIAPGAALSHLGVMLGRDPVGVRLHVSGLPLAKLGAFLDAVGWPGPAREAIDASRMLLDYADQLVLCFDMVAHGSTTRLLPRIGLEAFFEQKRGVDPRWRSLFDELASRDLASPSKAASLLAWPGMSTPATARGVWPASLVIRSLNAPAHHLGVIERRLSHVKLVVDPRGTAAKAYFGYGHLWIDRKPSSSASDIVAQDGAPARVEHHSRAAVPSASEALARAEQFLLSARNQGGWWRDFFDVARSPRVGERVVGFASDEWVTAYVACTLARSASSASVAAAKEAWALLARRRADSSGGGWGYHAQLPPDADTTAWTLRLCNELGVVRGERQRAAEQFIASLTSFDGGVATYREEDARLLASFLTMPGSYAGWCSTHRCVTAAVARLTLDAKHLHPLLNSQHVDGRWTGHWWDDDEYPTLLTADALLSATDDGETEMMRRRAASWAATRVAPTGAVYSDALAESSVFATSLAVSTIVSHGGDTTRAALHRAVRWLCGIQRRDGSFPASALLRVPAPHAVDPLADPASTIVYLDNHRIFTTATACEALRRAVEVGVE